MASERLTAETALPLFLVVYWITFATILWLGRVRRTYGPTPWMFFAPMMCFVAMVLGSVVASTLPAYGAEAVIAAHLLLIPIITTVAHRRRR